MNALENFSVVTQYKTLRQNLGQYLHKIAQKYKNLPSKFFKQIIIRFILIVQL